MQIIRFHFFLLAFAGTILSVLPLNIRADDSLIRNAPPGWTGFQMTTEIEAGYIPAGANLHDAATPRVSEVNTGAASVNPLTPYPATAEAGVPPVAISKPPDSGNAKDIASGTVEFFYRLAPNVGDDWGFDLTTTTSAVNAMVDFGSGPEPADSFVAVRLLMTTRGPYLTSQGAQMTLPVFGPLNDPARESMIALLRLGQPFLTCPNYGSHSGWTTTIGYIAPSDPMEPLVFPFNLCDSFFHPTFGVVPPDEFSFDFRYEIVTPFGTDPTYSYQASGVAASIAPGPASPVVVNTNDSGAGSLRQAVIDAGDEGTVTFAPHLGGQTISLTSGEMLVAGKTVRIDGTALASPVTIDAGNNSRILRVSSTGVASLHGLVLQNGVVMDADGGGILNQGSLTMTDCWVQSCSAVGAFADGGGVASVGAASTSVLWRCRLMENTAGNSGGGILAANGATLILSGCELAENNGSSRGGGVAGFNHGEIRLRDCSIHGNISNLGGGISLETASETSPEVIVNNSTIAKNGAESGAAIHMLGAAQLNVRHSTITENTGDDKAAVYAETSGDGTFFSSILSNNQPDDVDLKNGTLTSDGSNLVGSGDSLGDFGASGDLTGITDPELSPLGSYGSPTPVMIPLAGSPAIDAGGFDAQSLPLDQRGVARPVDGDLDGTAQRDIGSVEATAPTLVVTNTNDSGPGSLRQVATDIPDGGQVLFADHLAGETTSLTSGEILIVNKTITIDASSIKTAEGDRFQMNGGGLSRLIHVDSDSDLTMRAVHVRNGDAGISGDGGGIVNRGTLAATDCEFSENTASTTLNASGGAISSDDFNGDLTLQACVFRDNSAKNGGAVSFIFTQASMVDCHFTGNGAENSGGAVHAPISSALTAEHCEFSFNHAGSRGGGLYFEGIADLKNCSIFGNRSGSGGGGFSTSSLSSSVEFEQCTIFGNSARWWGGGILIDSGTATFRHCTITTNDSGIRFGSGVAVRGVTASFFSSIISGNRHDADVDFVEFSTVTSDGYNISGGGNALVHFTSTGDQTGITDPVLGPLGANGGALPTLYPLPGSPVIDAGATDASSTTTDQRGEPRTVDGDGTSGAITDVGAIEAAVPEVIVVANSNDSGPGSLRQAIADAATRGARISFAAALDNATITLSSGELSLVDRSLLIDASSLTNGITIDAAGASRVLLIDENSSATLRGLTISNGSTTDFGGGIWTRGGLSVIDCSFTSNSSKEGGGIAANGPSLLVDDSQFSGNSTILLGQGGGISLQQTAVMAIAGSTFTGNTSGSQGGALHFAYGTFESGSTGFIDHTLFSGNQAPNGGAIYTIGGDTGCLTLTHSTFTTNSATVGGALEDRAFGLTILDHCTFENNQGSGTGGAIVLEGGALDAGHCTITGNSAPAGRGGGIWSVDSEVQLVSTIVSGNTGSDVDEGIDGLFTSEGYNLIGFGNALARFSATGDQTTVNNPRLAPLGDYGGPVPTMHPLPGSPVIDAGGFEFVTILTPPITSDQRGFERVFDGDADGSATVDIGAVEYAPLVLQTLTVTNLNDFGPGSLRQAVTDSTPGTLIIFDASLDGGTIALSGSLPMPIPFVKIDAGALGDGITLNGQLATRLIEIKPTGVVDLCAITIEDGHTFECGGGIINEGILTMIECTVRGCVAEQNGGGICNLGGRLALSGSSLIGNEANGADPDTGRGGGIFNEGELTFNTVTATQCTFADNTAAEYGGGMFNFLGKLDLRHSTIAYNTAGDAGAGVATFGDLSAETHVFSTIIGGNNGPDVDFVLDLSNQFFSGGYNLIGIGNATVAFNKPGDLPNIASPSLSPLGDYGGRTLTILPRSNSLALEGGGSEAFTPTTDQRGFPRKVDLGHDGIVLSDIGAVEIGPVPFPTNNVVITSSGDFGAGSLRDALGPDIIPGTHISFSPALEGTTIGLISEIPITGIFIKIDGRSLPGGISISGSGLARIFSVDSQTDLEICGVTLRDGSEIGGNGGAIRNEGFLTLTECNLFNNEAANGGAIHNALGQLTLIDSTFAANTADLGAAVYHDGDQIDRTALIDQCTFGENFASEQGGALYNLMGTMTVRHSTISQNEALAAGGGIATNGDSSVETSLFSTIVAGNTGAEDIAIVLDPLDRYVSHGGNLIGFTLGTSAFPGIEDQIGITNPGLSALGDHGGRTPTMIVEFGSPARDAGGTDPNSRLNDQRGFVRSHGLGTDIGAYEASGNGGYIPWAAENIPAGEDRSSGGNADCDDSANGYEYALGTDPYSSDPGHANNFMIHSGSIMEFGFFPQASGVIWRIVRSTDLLNWTEIYRYDGVTETPGTDIGTELDPFVGHAALIDESPPDPRAFYRLEVLIVP